MYMPCKIGITTDINKTKAEHKKAFADVHSFKVMQSNVTQEQALSWVKMLPKYHNCEQLNGCEPNGEENWSAYHFYWDGEEGIKDDVVRISEES